MKVLVAFGTSEGQTRKIAKNIVDKIREHGDEAELYDCGRRPRGQDVEDFDAFIVAGSVHQKLHQEEVVAYATAHRQQLKEKPSAFVSVSLSAGFKDGHQDAQEYIELFTEATGWQPSQVHMAGGALKLSEYDFFKEQIIRHVVMAGRDLPPGQKDYEFTDWAALDAFVDEFLNKARALGA
jgi:menaquinone-dependent protoporphyrinogen oxidase